ncbi:PfkB family carbohydrate kinase [Methanobrevibacter sp.]
MTLVVIGPVTNDLIIIGDEKSKKVGGATYFQSFVFEEFFSDYLAIVNCADESLADDFPDSAKVKVIGKKDTHYFVNCYPDEDNLDIRQQLSNFADIPILRTDLEDILPSKIDAFVVNPLNRFDFPAETIDYLKSFNVPIFMSVQGFLRIPDVKVNDNYTLKLEYFNQLPSILAGVDAIFMDDAEANMIGIDYDIDEIVVTEGSHGSNIISSQKKKIRIPAVKCDEVVDTTGCGDTYMATYITQKLLSKSSETAGNFASFIASQKIKNHGPYNPKK